MSSKKTKRNKGDKQLAVEALRRELEAAASGAPALEAPARSSAASSACLNSRRCFQPREEGKRRKEATSGANLLCSLPSSSALGSELKLAKEQAARARARGCVASAAGPALPAQKPASKHPGCRAAGRSCSCCFPGAQAQAPRPPAPPPGEPRAQAPGSAGSASGLAQQGQSERKSPAAMVKSRPAPGNEPQAAPLLAAGSLEALLVARRRRRKVARARKGATVHILGKSPRPTKGSRSASETIEAVAGLIGETSRKTKDDCCVNALEKVADSAAQRQSSFGFSIVSIND